MTFTRLSGFAAWGFALTVLVATAVLRAAGLPTIDAPTADVATFFTANAVPVGISTALAPVAWVLLAVFGAGAAAALLPLERRRGEAWSVVGVIGIVMQNLIFGGSVAAQAGLLAGADPAGGLWALHNALFSLNGVGLAIAMVGFTVAGLRTRQLRAWHAGIGVLAAALQFIAAALTPVTLAGGPAGLSYIGFAGFVLWLVWLVAFGRVLVTMKLAEPAIR